MGAQIGGTGGPQADINVTPLVDIVLVLLIIFMVITPLLAKNIPIEVPEKTELNEPPPEIKEQIVLKLFADGHAELNHTPVSTAELEGRLRSKFANRSQRVMFFEGEDDAVYGQAVKLMDIARGAGASTIGIMTPGDTENEASGLAGDAYAAAYGSGRSSGGPRLGRIGAGTPTILGKADSQAVMAIMQRYQSDLLACYESEAAKGRALSGTVVTKVQISGSGAVITASTQSSSLASPATEACISSRFKAMSFPAGQPGTVSFPLGFEPNTEL
jgi:biopolymer transport protein ExbD